MTNVYRGKNKENKWVYGKLLGDNILVHVHTQLPNEIKINEFSIVKPESVGKLTQLRDSIRKQMYEGDVYGQEGYWNHYLTNENGNTVSVSCNLIQRINNKPFILTQEEIDAHNFKIIGNIYDNPELLN